MVTSSPTSGPAAPAPPRSMPAWITRCRTPSGSTRRMSRPPSPTPASRSRPSTVPWCAATPRCSGSDSSSGLRSRARLMPRPTASSPEPSAPRSPFCSRTKGLAAARLARRFHRHHWSIKVRRRGLPRRRRLVQGHPLCTPCRRWKACRTCCGISARPRP